MREQHWWLTLHPGLEENTLAFANNRKRNYKVKRRFVLVLIGWAWAAFLE